MKLIDSRLEHRVCYECAALPVFRFIGVCDNPVLLNGFWGDRRNRAASFRPAPTLALVVVVIPFEQEVAHSRPRSVHRRAACRAPEIVRYNSCHKINECVLVSNFERQRLPHARVHQLRDLRLRRSNEFSSGLHCNCFTRTAYVEMYINRIRKAHADHDARHFGGAESFMFDPEGIRADHWERCKAIRPRIGRLHGSLGSSVGILQSYLRTGNRSAARVIDRTRKVTRAALREACRS